MKTFRQIREAVKQLRTWFDIGHNMPYEETDLWWMKDGKIEIHNDPSGVDTHGDIFIGQTDYPQYWGRVEHGTKRISMQARSDIPLIHARKKFISKRLLQHFGRDYSVFYAEPNMPRLIMIESSENTH